MTVFDRWQAPDRDSPTLGELTATVALGKQLGILLQMDGREGMTEKGVKAALGEDLSRPRRWHKIFERSGLLYEDDAGLTRLTDLGDLIKDLETNEPLEFRRKVARSAVSILRKFQLKNPADETSDKQYSADCDIHPYWAIWKAALELDGKLHWDELNRVLFWVLRHQDLNAAIARIKAARAQPGYNPVKGGTKTNPLGDRAYDQDDAPGSKDPDGQVRDQRTTPWFKRAGFLDLLLVNPGAGGGGYWTIAPDLRDIVASAVETAPAYLPFAQKNDWFEYYGSLPVFDEPSQGEAPKASSTNEFEELMDLVRDRRNAVFYGPPGTGKTRAALGIAKEWEAQYGAGSVFSTTFHPSYGYEDFVQGFKPDDTNPATFVLKQGILLDACDFAETNPTTSALILIDEINRGDVARIFGELITYIEPDKRGTPFPLAQSPKKKRAVPPNLCFLGTMNTADKSVSLMDVAIRRRFAFVEFDPDPDLFKKSGLWVGTLGGVSVGDVLKTLNRRLLQEGVEPDRAIGHALLAVPHDHSDPASALLGRFKYDVLPLIREYCYMDRTKLKRVLKSLVNDAGHLPENNETFATALKAFVGSPGMLAAPLSVTGTDEPEPGQVS
jgi:hypothetical protein